jgi:hypothetical protein
VTLRSQWSRPPRPKRRGLTTQQLMRFMQQAKQRRIADQIAMQAEQQARSVQTGRAPIPPGIVAAPPGPPGLFSKALSAITSQSLMGDLPRYIEKASLPFQAMVLPGVLDVFRRGKPGQKAFRELGAMESFGFPHLFSKQASLGKRLSFDPSKIEEAKAQTKLPPGVMGATELLADPFAGVGKASKAYKAASLGGRRFGLLPSSPDPLFGPKGRGARDAFKMIRDAPKPKVSTMAPTPIPSIPSLLRSDVTPSRTMRKLHDLQIGSVKPLAWFVRHMNAAAVIEPDDVVGNASLAYNRLLEQGGDNAYEPMKGRLGGFWEAALWNSKTNPSGIKIEKVLGDVLEPAPGIRAKAWRSRRRLGITVPERRVTNYAVVNARPVKGADARPLLHDFLERRGAYHYTPETQRFLNAADEVLEFITKAQKAEGVSVNELIIPEGGKWMPRVVTSIRGVATRPGVKGRIGATQDTQQPRWYELAKDGHARGIEYANDPVGAIEVAFKGGIHSIADQRLAKAIKAMPGVRTGRASLTIRVEKNIAEDTLDAAMKLHRVARIAGQGITRGARRIGKVENDLNNLRGHLQEVTNEITERGAGPESLRRHTISWLRNRQAITRSKIQVLERELKRVGGPSAQGTPLDVSRSVAGATTAKIERVFPGTNVRELLRKGSPDEIKALLDESVQRVAVAKKKLVVAKRKQAASLKYGQKIKLDEGEAIINHPAFRGQIVPEEVAKAVKRIHGEELGKSLKVIRTASGFARTLGTVYDVGWGFLQGQLLLATQPLLWGKTMRWTAEALIPGKGKHAWERFMSDPEHYAAAQELASHGGAVQATGELVEAAAKGGALSKVPLLGPIAVPFERAFTLSGNAARILWWEAERNIAARKGTQGLDELADFVGKATGVMSQANLGISQKQQAFETLLLFAPRFTKASFGLIADALQGGTRGRLARDSLAKLAMAGTLTYIGIGKAIGQTPHLNPLPVKLGGDGGKFMTYRVFGQNVGVPGAFVSITRLLAHSVATLDQDPDAFLSVDPRTGDQPFIRFLRGKMAPVSSGVLDTILGRTFIGEPTTESPLQWSTEVVGSRLMPFWAESFLFDNPRPGLGGIGEFAALRTFPVSLWERRNDLRQKYSDDRWDELSDTEQRNIEKQHPDLQEAAERARDLSVDRGDSLTLLIDEQSSKFHEAREKFIASLEKAQEEFELTDVSPARFKDKFADAGRLYRARVEDIEADERFAEIAPFFRDLDAEKAQPFANVASDMYIAEVVANPDLEDRFGNYDYDMRKELDEAFKVKWGEPVWRYVRQGIEESRESEPLLARELRDGRENPLFRAYFETDKLALENIGRPELLPVYREYRNADPVRRDEMDEAMPILKQVSSAISRARIRMRERNRVLDGFLFRFGYTTTVRHEDNIGREASILDFGTR